MEMDENLHSSYPEEMQNLNQSERQMPKSYFSICYEPAHKKYHS